VLLLALALPSRVAADVGTDLRDSAQGVMRADDLFRRERWSEINVDKEVATLTRLIDSGALNPAGMSVAYYWRARAYTALNWVRMKRAAQADATLARNSLADFDKVIAHGIDVSGWGVSVADAMYGAGGVARNHLEDYGRAYGYWQKCAALNHAGCLNIMASARLTGAGGVLVNLEQSLELNKRVYETGTDYRCAGAYSALAIAHILHFAGMQATVVDQFEWMRRAYLLLDELEQADKTDNPCDRSKFEIADYLMRLGRGEKKPELLRAAANRSAGNQLKPLAEYMLGNSSRQSFQDSLSTIALKHVLCDAHFLASWYADIQEDAAGVAAHRKAMADLGGDHCQIELALVRLKTR
jgi:hypothetical protein